MDMKNRFAAALCAASLATSAGAVDFRGVDLSSFKKKLGLGGPEVELNINHPPALPLRVTTIAIAEPEGQCADGVAARVEEDFVQAGVTVIDRQRLAAV